MFEVASDIIGEARRWLGTPYQHQASVCGAGCDCLGLIRGVWRAVVGPEVMDVPPYTPNWATEQGAETLLDAARSCLESTTTPAPGDVLAFRMIRGGLVTHLGILSTPDSFIHAYARRAVVESPFGPWWRRRHTHTFRFPA